MRVKICFLNVAISLSALSVVMSAMSVFAQEIPPQKFREWTYQKANLREPLGQVCMATTQKQIDGMSWTFAVIADPAQKRPPAIFVVAPESAAIKSSLSARTDSRASQFVHLRHEQMDAALEGDAFWFAPSRFSELLKQIRRDSSLRASYRDSSGVDRALPVRESLPSKKFFSAAGRPSWRRLRSAAP